MKRISMSKLRDLYEVTNFFENPPLSVLEEWYVTEEDGKTKHKYSDKLVKAVREIRIARTKINIIIKNK